MLYLHETIDVRPDKVEEFGPSLAALYRPAMEASGARFMSLWETVAFCLPWPRFVCMWEMDGIGSVSSLLAAQQSTRRHEFGRWRHELGRLATSVEGRMLTPSPSSRTVAELAAAGTALDTIVHEWIGVPQNQGENYCKQLEARYAPFAGIFNRVFVGTYHEVWNNKEAINIWALPDEFTVFPGGEITANNVTASAEIESWIVLSVGLRESFHSGLLRRVDMEAAS